MLTLSPYHTSTRASVEPNTSVLQDYICSMKYIVIQFILISLQPCLHDTPYKIHLRINIISISNINYGYYRHHPQIIFIEYNCKA